MKKEKVIINIDDRKTIDYGIFSVELDFMHYLTDEEFAYCKKLLEVVKDCNTIDEFSIYKKAGNNIYYRLPDKGLKAEGLMLTSFLVGVKIISIDGLATVYFHDNDIYIIEDDLKKVINVSRVLTDSEFDEWKKTEDRNFMYELGKSREINNRLGWDNYIMLDAFRMAITEIKKYDRKDFYQLDRKSVDIVLSADQYSDEDLRRALPNEINEGRNWVVDCTGKYSCCFILDDIVPRKFGEDYGHYNRLGSYIKYETEKRQLHVVLREGMIDVVERIGWYDKEVVYERRVKREHKERLRAEERTDIACLILLVLALVGLVMYLILWIKM